VQVGRAIRRVAEHFGFQNVDDAAIQRIRQALGQLPPETRPLEHEGFLWASGADLDGFDVYRTHDPSDPDLRRPEEVAPIEIKNAIVDVLKRHGSLPVDDLARTVSRCFGHEDAPEMHQRIHKIAAVCASRGLCVLDGETIGTAA